jgi:hypothetical protein
MTFYCRQKTNEPLLLSNCSFYVPILILRVNIDFLIVPIYIRASTTLKKKWDLCQEERFVIIMGWSKNDHTRMVIGWKNFRMPL